MRAVVSTNALELGIDIGALDVSVMAGYPGTIAATWQRAGRAGRRTGRSAAVLVASAARRSTSSSSGNPSYFFDASPEHALINPDNLHILVDHVKCAAFELPFSDRRAVRPPATSRRCSACSARRASSIGRPDDGEWHWTQRVVSGRCRQPAVGLVGQLRGGRHDARRRRDRRDQLHQRPARRCTRRRSTWSKGTLYPGGAARLRGPQGLRARRSTATTTPTPSPTRRSRSSRRSRRRRDPDGDEATAGGSSAVDATRTHGEVHVVSRVVGFKKIKFYTQRERRLGRARPARAADAHDRLLADHPARA